MRVVPTRALQGGMRLGKAIRSADGTVLLKAGMELRESFIQPLLQHGITSIYIINELAPDVEPDDIVSSETRQSLAVELRNCMGQLEEALSTAAGAELTRLHVQLNITGLRRAANLVVAEVLANPSAVLNLQDIRKVDEYTLGHSTNVCVLATLLGGGLGLKDAELKELALGALLHDIGKTLVPQDVLHKPAPLTRELQGTGVSR